MNQPTEQETADGWIKNQENWWAWEAVDNACRDNPELGWRLVTTILASSDSPFVIGNLGAGPLEDLLANFGELLIGRAEELAKSNIKFRQCLAATWQNSMSGEIWARVCRATDRDPSNPHGYCNDL